MTQIDRDIVTRKLAAMTRYLNLLKSMSTLDQATYLQDFKQQLVVERLLHLIVEAATDINSHLLVGLGQPSPESYYDSFVLLGRNQIIPIDLAMLLAPSAGLRNRLVHEYDEIDPIIVFQSMSMALDIFPIYIGHIQNYLECHNAS